ncbi:MAG: Na(+)/H(+) antiporter NhaA [Rhodothermaceae bacterium]|nr:MAG: Na(+)/H(+) antiporter NhaA [Rhodothermaceae bacterium]
MKTTTTIPANRLFRPFQRFFEQEAAGGILLLVCAVIALLWANSPFSESYFGLWETLVTVGVGGFVISKPLLLWINDGLMAIFFFVVGLEIKREVLVGELSSPKAAALAVAAAFGGMVVPAALYTLLNAGTEGASGWGIPMATDIAFALGVLALLGSRAPLALKVFLTALAIVDDLGAVLVIALFYTAEISWGALGAGAGVLVALVAANRLRIQRPAVYVVLGIALWVAFLKSGIHATVAGVLLALTIPARRRLDTHEFLARGNELLRVFARDVRPGKTEPSTDQRDALHALEVTCRHAETPLIRMEHALHGWVAFLIIPLFALANAGVALGGDLGAAFGNRVTLGIVLGLFVGKQIGVTGFAWLAVRLGWAALPAGVTWRQIYGVSYLCGIGFTMSLFIANLAFAEAALLDSAKVGILTASLVAGLGGWFMLTRGVNGKAQTSAS